MDRDHTRVCGKNNIGMTDKDLDTGSPPRVREKRTLFFRKNMVHRITPACAGKTPMIKAIIATSRDYPRVCGENLVEQLISGLWIGITPACAGKTTVIALSTRFIFACSTQIKLIRSLILGSSRRDVFFVPLFLP